MEVLNNRTEKVVGKNGKTTTTIREEYENNETKCLTVRECENGFIVRIEHNYRKKIDGKDDYQYVWDEKEYISFTNPLESIKKPKEEKKKEITTKEIANSINSFLSGMSGKISV